MASWSKEGRQRTPQLNIVTSLSPDTFHDKQLRSEQTPAMWVICSMRQHPSEAQREGKAKGQKKEETSQQQIKHIEIRRRLDD